MILPRFPDWRGPTLAMQIMGLLLGGLVVAQLVTLALTLFLPPEPPARYGMAEIAIALRAEAGDGDGLRRELRDTAPPVGGRGWLESPPSRDELAQRLGVAPPQVRLAFYTPLPFAGIAAAPGSGPPPPGAMVPVRGAPPPSTTAFRPVPPSADDGAIQAAVLLLPVGRSRPADLLRLVQAGPGGPGGPHGGLPGGGFPGGGLPGRGFPGGRFPGGFPGGRGPGGGGLPNPPTTQVPGASPAAQSPATSFRAGTGPAASPTGPADGHPGGLPSATADMPMTVPMAAPLGLGVPSLVLTAPALSPTAPSATLPEPRSEEPRRTEREPAREAPVATAPVPHPVAAPPAPAARDADATATRRAATPERAGGGGGMPPAEAAPLVRTGLGGAIDRARRLFGLAPAPFVEGDFVAAWHRPDGRWAVVRPRPAGLLSPWQKRVALWFLVAFGIVAPIGWLFARRLSLPLDRFADAAARLGRDPSVAIAALDGPAEIGRAAHAFNLMQRRLRAFVDDRTAMVGAISHDLRTPLTRMRFRIEDVADELRDGLLDEVEEMEAMISSVLAFIRDASTPGVRERLDLRTLLDDVVEDAAVVGATVPVEAIAPATVEVDVLGMRRVLANLVNNALKYGEHARIQLTVLQGEAVAAVIDDGPGLADEELEQVFQPFYRTAAARASSAPGTGLGLAVCRSIARAHGGDVTLRRSTEGFRAEVRVPLAFDGGRAMAA
jgi:signal transduction histidine kinase